jgi:opacity protein-like surface antigen
MKKSLVLFLCAGFLLFGSDSRGDQPGPVSDAMFTFGMSTNEREGLHPRHASDAEYGMRIDGRFFLGSLVDDPILGGFGVGGHFNQVFNLNYGISNNDTWEASQIQWQVEIMYRLALEKVFFKPTFMLRTGYGSTSCVIDADHSLALSASYGYPFAALDVYLMVVDPYLRVHASAGYMFALVLGEDLGGSGWGYSFSAGLDMAILEEFVFGLGYERVHFSIDDEEMGEASDSYRGFFVRAGWNFR